MFPSRDVYISTIKFNALFVQFFLSSSHLTQGFTWWRSKWTLHIQKFMPHVSFFVPGADAVFDELVARRDFILLLHHSLFVDLSCHWL